MKKIDELFKLARSVEPPSYGIEMGLEARVLTRVRAERELHNVWFTWTWRLAPVFAVLVMALGGWYYSFSSSVDMRTAIAADYEQTMHLASFMGD